MAIRFSLVADVLFFCFCFFEHGFGWVGLVGWLVGWVGLGDAWQCNAVLSQLPASGQWTQRCKKKKKPIKKEHILIKSHKKT